MGWPGRLKVDTRLRDGVVRGKNLSMDAGLQCRHQRGELQVSHGDTTSFGSEQV